MKKRLLSFAALLSLAFSGCSFNGRQTITLGIFAGSAWQVNESVGYELLDAMIDRFENEHPGVTVEYESGIRVGDYESWLNDRIIMGDVPDVFVVMDQNFGKYASLGLLKNLDPYIRSDDQIQESMFFAAAWEQSTFHYSQYALPYLMNPQMMFVNVSLLKKEGLDVPDTAWTLDDFEAIAKAATKDTDGDGVIDQYGCAGYGWLDLADAYGLSVFDDGGTSIDLTNARAVLEQYARLHQYMGGSQDRDTLLDAGKTIFAPMSYAEFITYNTYPWKIKKYTDFEWICIPMPKSMAAQPRYMGESLLVAMNSECRHGNLAWDLMKMFCADKESQKALLSGCQGFTSLQLDDSSYSLLEEASGLSIKPVQTILQQNGRKASFPQYEQARQKLGELMEEAATESTDLDLSLAEIEQEMQSYLKN